MSSTTMIEVFKTTINNLAQAMKVSKALEDAFGECRISFDLEDSDKILRLESKTTINNRLVINVLNQLGFKCFVLPD